MKLTHFSLCSGVGGIDLAAEWAGFETIAQCETDDYASKVLKKNFPGVRNFGDIRTITNDSVRAAGIESNAVTAVSAGFPCQPYSLAGKGLGDGDSRDLWGEVKRVVGLLKPRWFVGENTPGLFARANQRYFARVVNDLSALGYSVSWGMWGACDVGALHIRQRVFILAHAGSVRREGLEYCEQKQRGVECLEVRQFTEFEKITARKETGTLFRLSRVLPYPSGRIQRNDNGLSAGLDKLRCLGNAVVPQQAYPIFKAIADFENSFCEVN